MPRPPRIFAPGAIYHAYNRISSGEPVLGIEGEADRLIELIVDVKTQDEWTVFAWCVMSNHYHLVVRTGEIPLWRGLHRMQNVFSRRFNERNERTGPLWQSRYHAKVVRDESYLDRLILYVHSNPLRAGLVRDPAAYPYSGHAELVGEEGWGLIDADQSLLCFGEHRRRGLANYRSALSAYAHDAAADQRPTHSEPGVADEPLHFPEDVPYINASGRSSTPERPRVSATEFVAAACSELAIEPELIAGRSKAPAVSRARRLIVGLATERWALRVVDIADFLNKLSESVSRWASRGARERVTDDEFRESYEQLDRALLKRFTP